MIEVIKRDGIMFSPQSLIMNLPRILKYVPKERMRGEMEKLKFPADGVSKFAKNLIKDLEEMEQFQNLVSF